MSEDKFSHGLGKRALVAYISESRDREGNTFYEASICDDEKNEIVKELSDYDRDDLIAEVGRQYPDIDVENG